MYDIHAKLPAVALLLCVVSFIIAINHHTASDWPVIVSVHTGLIVSLLMASVIQWRCTAYELPVTRQIISLTVMWLFGFAFGDHSNEHSSDVVLLSLSYIGMVYYYAHFYASVARRYTEQNDLVHDSTPNPCSPLEDA